MPVSERTVVGVRCQVRLQPLVLGRTATAAADITAIGIQGNDMPCPDVEAVIALTGLPGCGPEVVKIPGRTLVGAGAISAA